MQEIERALNYLRDTAKQYAIAKGQCEYLKQFRKSKKAILMIQAEKEGVTSAVKQEAQAYSNSEYIDLLDGLRVAIEEECRLRHMITSAELKIEVWRTKESTRRTEMNNYNRNVV